MQFKKAQYFCTMIEDKNPQRTPLSELGEFKLIEHLTEHFKVTQKSTVKSIGDDAAVLSFGKKQVVVSTDLWSRECISI